MADLFAPEYGYQVHYSDEHCIQHLERAKSEQATLTKLRQRSWLELITQPLETMIQDALGANQELGELALQDLQQLEGQVIAEGMPFMPDLMAKLALRAVYLVPTKAFQRQHYAKREWAWGLLEQTSDPQATFDLWMSRDASTARFVASRARELGFEVLEVAGTLTIPETLAWLEQQFEVI